MIAFVMSGGSNRGALEAGMLLALIEAGIRPDMLVGTSAGALNAGFLATDPSPEGARRLADIWAGARKEDFFPGGRFSMLKRLLRGQSLFSSDALRQSLERRFPPDKRRFGDLQGIRLYVTAANLNTGTLYLYGDQPEAFIIDAVLASAAHPLAFPPVRYQNLHLVDGGVVANVPVGIAVDKGATEIYILNVGYSGELVEGGDNVLKVLGRSISVMMYQHFLMDLKYAVERSDVILHHIGIRQFQEAPMWDLSYSAQMVEAGERATREYLGNPTGLQDVPVGVCGAVGEEPIPPVGAESYTPPWLSPSDLLDLPALERQIATHLARRGPVDVSALAPVLGREDIQVRDALSTLVGKGHVRLTSDGQAQVVLGRTRRRRLPDQIWTELASEDSREQDSP